MSKRSAIVAVGAAVLLAGLVLVRAVGVLHEQDGQRGGSDSNRDCDRRDVADPGRVDGTRERQFVGQEHETSGTATIIELPDGSRTLRLEGFKTTNGPDLHVWLSEKTAAGNWFKYGGGRKAQLGELKANRGSHNYAIPADVQAGRTAQRRHLVQAVPRRLRVRSAQVMDRISSSTRVLISSRTSRTVSMSLPAGSSSSQSS